MNTKATKERPFYVFRQTAEGAQYVQALTCTGIVRATTPNVSERRYFTHRAAVAVTARNGAGWLIGNGYYWPA